MRKIVHRPSLRMTNLLNRELDKTRTPLLSQQEEALNAYCRHNIGATTGPPGVGEPNQGNKAHTRPRKQIHTLKELKEGRETETVPMPRQGSEGLALINRKAIGFLLSFNRPMSGLASQGARVSPRTERPWTRSDYKRPQAQRRSNGSQGIPEASDLGVRVRRCTKQCLAHTQLLDNKISDESICLGVGMVKAWMKHN